MNKLFCKLTGGHRFQGEPVTSIDKNEIVHFYHKCKKCGTIEEFTVPWICLWRAGVIMTDSELEALKKQLYEHFGIDEKNWDYGYCIMGFNPEENELYKTLWKCEEVISWIPIPKYKE